MTPADPPEPVSEGRPSPPPDDELMKGIGWALLWQLGAIILSIPTMFTVWGILQWFALVPLYIKWRRRGYRLATKGVLIMGFVGMLLNGTCAYLVLGNMSFR